MVRVLVIDTKNSTPITSLQAVKKVFSKKITKKILARALASQNTKFFLDLSKSSIEIDNQTYFIETTINSNLQETLEKIFLKSQIKMGALVAIDPETGKILSMISYGDPNENLALKASFPAASIFKIITAAAAIEQGKLNAYSLIPVTGSYHTLYKPNLFKSGALDPRHAPKYARLISLSDAFAKSVNSVFGKIGIYATGAETLKQKAFDFGFNQEIPFEMPVQISKIKLNYDPYGIAESASGFTYNNTLSPLHGAMIAATIANNGVLMEPSIVQQLSLKDGTPVYQFEPTVFKTIISEKTANELKIMMAQTITHGTSKSSFKNFFKRTEFKNFYVGGKTGTLNSIEPKGRADWFVGISNNKNKKLAIAVLCIHGELRGMKASQIARYAIEKYYQNEQLSRHDLYQ